MPRRTDISSFLIGGAALLLMGQASAQEMRPPPPNYEKTIAAIAACGIAAAQVRITYEDELQSDLVRIGDLGGSDEARFRCLRKAVHPFYIVDVSAAPQHEAYSAFADREDRRQAKAMAVAWLGARGKLGKVPRYDPAGGLNTFARAVEAACSVREGSALEAVAESGLTFRVGFLQKSTDSRTYDQFACLMQMIAASDADQHDVRLMLVGNEAYQTEKPK